MEINLIKNIYYKKNKIAPEIIIKKSNRIDLKTNELHLETDKLHLKTDELHLKTDELHLETDELHLETDELHLETNQSIIDTNQSIIDTNQSIIDTNQSHLETNQSVEEFKYINNLVSSNDPIIDITASINKKFIDEFGKGIEISMFTIIKDFIRNFRTLNEFQLDNLNKLSEDEKIEIIKLYNNVYKTIETLI